MAFLDLIDISRPSNQLIVPTQEATLSKKAFVSEAELVYQFTQSIPESLNAGFTFEFDCSYGIADIVLYHLAANRKTALPIHELPVGWAYALTLLPYRKSFKTEYLQKLTASSRSLTLRMLKLFLEAGFVKLGRDNDSWLKFRQPRPVVRDLAAIEAKLSNWRRALHQAIRYLHFANYSWVLLDSASSRSALKHLDRFRWYNVGLASFDGNGSLKVHHQPNRSEPKSPHLYWMANVKLAKQIFTQGNVGNTD